MPLIELRWPPVEPAFQLVSLTKHLLGAICAGSRGGRVVDRLRVCVRSQKLRASGKPLGHTHLHRVVRRLRSALNHTEVRGGEALIGRPLLRVTRRIVRDELSDHVVQDRVLRTGKARLIYADDTEQVQPARANVSGLQQKVSSHGVLNAQVVLMKIRRSRVAIKSRIAYHGARNKLGELIFRRCREKWVRQRRVVRAYARVPEDRVARRERLGLSNVPG